MSKYFGEIGLITLWNTIKEKFVSVDEIDSQLNNTSENPVQNKIIKTALDSKQNSDELVELTNIEIENLLNGVM